MATRLPDSVTRLLADRRALLWVCQRYDLLPDESPHDYDLPDTEAALRYRRDVSDLDRSLAAYFWEAAWLEGASSRLLDAFRSVAEGQASSTRRPVVVLASEDDAQVELSSQEFFPVSVLPGVLGSGAVGASTYGVVRGRVREWTARSLAARLERYRGRALVVLGARDASDLGRLYEILEDRPVTELEILLVWPSERPEPPAPANTSVRLHRWSGTEEELATALGDIGAPLAGELPEWSIRVGTRQIRLSARDVSRVTRRFVVLTERQLAPPEVFSVEDLVAFLEGSLENWAGYHVGLPVARAYRSAEGLSLSEELFGSLKRIEEEEGQVTSVVLQLPAESGAGATTLIREAAFRAARRGYPTLVMRPEQVEVDLEELVALATTLHESSLAAGVDNPPPIVVVLDVEHVRATNAGALPGVLASHGRPAVVLQAIQAEEDELGERRTRRLARLETLRSAVSPEEIGSLHGAIERLVAKWTLPIDVPSKREWHLYEEATRWPLPGGRNGSSLFWVTLRFFLTEGMSFDDAERAQDALGRWIARRAERIGDDRMRQVVSFVAALSTFRIVGPVFTLLRPVTGGTYSSDFSDAMKQLDNIVRWEGPAEDLDDYILRFSHPALAEEYLRQRVGARTRPERIGVLTPVLANLSPGHAGDVWLAETVAADVLTPPFDERQSTDWDWRLDAFAKLPPTIAEQSKTVLHHWARCLYLSADPRNSPDLQAGERRARIEHAIEKLRKATELPRRAGRDEHPSHLYNTLGTAYFRLASLFDEIGVPADAGESAWNRACQAFEQAIILSSRANVEALLAFSHRLLIHARQSGESARTPSKAGDVLKALELLDEAEDLVQDHASPDPKWQDHIVQARADALGWLDRELGANYIEELKESSDPELGFVCEARLVLKRDPEDPAAVEKALAVLGKAEDEGIPLRARSLRLRISLLLRRPATRHDFDVQREIYRRLESDPDYSPRPIDLFRHAVVCYQTGHVQEGAERFRKLRELFRRQGPFPVRARDFWRDDGLPEEPRLTQMRVTRLITEWRAEAYVSELGQTVPFRPRHFAPPPRQGEIVTCAIRFEPNGPLAIPPRFVERRQHPSRIRGT